MNKLIIICGLSGSGKTTVACKLSQKLNIICLHKDSFKESLYDIFEYATLEESKRLGSQVMKMLFEIVEEQCKRSVDIMIEAPFNFKEDYEIFRQWEKQYGTKIYTVVCAVDIAERERRYRNRERHKAHHDTERAFPSKECDYLNIPGKRVDITTDKPVEILCKNIIKSLNLK